MQPLPDKFSRDSKRLNGYVWGPAARYDSVTGACRENVVRVSLRITVKNRNAIGRVPITRLNNFTYQISYIRLQFLVKINTQILMR